MSAEDGERDGWTEIRPSRSGLLRRLVDLWKYRELVGYLALRDIQVRYKQAIFGAAWAIVQPLAGAIMFTLVFRRLAGIPSDGLPYLAFAFCGFTLWSFLAGAVNSARGSLVGNASLITKVYFPRLAAPVAAILPSFVDLVPALVFLACFMWWYRISPSPRIIFFPLFVIAVFLVAAATGTLFAALTVEYRDIHQLFSLLLQVWLFASPVAYPMSLVPRSWRWIYAANPMTGILEGARWCILSGPAPGRETILSLISGLAVLVVSLHVFQRAERRFADVI